MRFALPLAAGCAAGLLTPVAAMAFAEGSDIQRVRSFLAAFANDRSAAQAMVAKDAQFGVGDVGGPFDLKLLDTLTTGCKIDGSKAISKPLDMPGKQVTVVVMALTCTRDGKVAQPQEIDFMVDNDQIAGFYLPMSHKNG